MLKRGKIFIWGLALALSVALLTPAVASVPEASISTPGYGTLYGCVFDYGGHVTQVTQNPDNAVLTFRGVIKDNDTGSTLYTQPTQYSNRGETMFSDWLDWYSLSLVNIKTIAIFGAHGVQSGGTYKAAAVYTSVVVPVPPDKTNPTD